MRCVVQRANLGCNTVKVQRVRFNDHIAAACAGSDCAMPAGRDQGGRGRCACRTGRAHARSQATTRQGLPPRIPPCRLAACAASAPPTRATAMIGSQSRKGGHLRVGEASEQERGRGASSICDATRSCTLMLAIRASVAVRMPSSTKPSPSSPRLRTQDESLVVCESGIAAPEARQ